MWVLSFESHYKNHLLQVHAVLLEIPVSSNFFPSAIPESLRLRWRQKISSGNHSGRLLLSCRGCGYTPNPVRQKTTHR